jgi:hypothetical protein
MKYSMYFQTRTLGSPLGENPDRYIVLDQLLSSTTAENFSDGAIENAPDPEEKEKVPVTRNPSHVLRYV